MGNAVYDNEDGVITSGVLQAVSFFVHPVAVDVRRVFEGGEGGGGGGRIAVLAQLQINKFYFKLHNRSLHGQGILSRGTGIKTGELRLHSAVFVLQLFNDAGHVGHLSLQRLQCGGICRAYRTCRGGVCCAYCTCCTCGGGGCRACGICRLWFFGGLRLRRLRAANHLHGILHGTLHSGA